MPSSRWEDLRKKRFTAKERAAQDAWVKAITTNATARRTMKPGKPRR